MSEFLTKINKLDNILEEVSKLRIELKKIFSQKEEKAAKLGVERYKIQDKEGDVIIDRLDNIVNNYFDDLQEIALFFKENKDDIIALYNRRQQEQEDFDKELQNDLDIIFSSDEMTKHFFEVSLPKNLKEDFNISDEEYKEILAQADLKADKEVIFNDIITKILEEKSPVSTVQFGKMSITNQLLEQNNKPKVQS